MQTSPLDDYVTPSPRITREQAQRASLYVCSRAADPDDARLLLRALGLIPEQETSD